MSAIQAANVASCLPAMHRFGRALIHVPHAFYTSRASSAPRAPPFECEQDDEQLGRPAVRVQHTEPLAARHEQAPVRAAAACPAILLITRAIRLSRIPIRNGARPSGMLARKAVRRKLARQHSRRAFFEHFYGRYSPPPSRNKSFIRALATVASSGSRI